VIFWKYFRQKWVFLTKFEPFVRENVMMCFQENFRIFAENWSKSPKISIITLTHAYKSVDTFRNGESWVARWYIFKRKISILVYFGGPYVLIEWKMLNYFYGHE
jgi:hypothetical protein